MNQIRESLERYFPLRSIWLDDVGMGDGKSIWLSKQSEPRYGKRTEAAKEKEYWALAGGILADFVGKVRQIVKQWGPDAQLAINWSAGYLTLPNRPERYKHNRSFSACGLAYIRRP